MRNAIGGLWLTLAICFFGMESQAQTPLGAGAEIAAFQDIADHLFEKAEDTGNFLMMEAANQIQSIIDRLENIVGKSLTKPLNELTGAVQTEFAAARATINSLADMANAAPACVGNEAQILAANIKAGISSSLRSIPFIEGDPIAYLVQQQGRRAPYTVVRESNDADIPITIFGSNLWSKSDTCEVEATALSLVRGRPQVNLSVMGFDNEKVDLALPAEIAAGQWSIKVRGRRKGTVFRCLWPKEEEVSIGLGIEEKQLLSITPEIRPVCAGYDEITQRESDSCTNGSYRHKKSCDKTWNFARRGFELVEFKATTTKGPRRASVRHRRVGDTVQSIVRLEKRKVGGGSPTVAYRLEMTGRKSIDPSVEKTISLEPLTGLRSGDSRAFVLNYTPPRQCEIDSWILSGKIEDGQAISAIPERKGLRGNSVSTNAQGVQLTFNGLTKSGTVEVSRSTCLGL